jgi:hypothetical protein
LSSRLIDPGTPVVWGDAVTAAAEAAPLKVDGCVSEGFDNGVDEVEVGRDPLIMPLEDRTGLTVIAPTVPDEKVDSTREGLERVNCADGAMVVAGA